MRALIGLLLVVSLLTGCGTKESKASQESLFQQGIKKLESKDYEEAEKLFHAHVAQAPNLSRGLAEVYRAYLRVRAYEPAYRFLLQYEPRADEIVVKIDRSDYYRALGETAYFAGRREEAFPWMEKSVELDPQNHLALNNYAYALAELNRDLDKALAMAERAVAIRSNQGAYYDTLAWVYFKRGEYEEAYKNIRIAVQTAPDSAELRYHYAEILAKMGQREDALVELEKALALQPGHEEARALRQRLLGEQKQ